MKLPPKVHQRGPSLYYVDKNKWTRLCAADAPERVVHGELWKLLQKGVETLGQVMDDYMAVSLPKLAYTTQRDYYLMMKSNGRLRLHFGHMRPDDLTSQDCAVYLEMRERDGHGARGNREIAALSSVYNHGMRIRAAKFNPTYGVRRNKEMPRTFYVTDESLRLAMKNTTPALRYLMWTAYLTGFRQGDLRRLTRSDLTADGIKIIQSKDGKHEIREWSESLRKVVRRALDRSKCDRVFTNAYGRAWTVDSIQCAMQRMKTKTSITWRFHDLRAKAESDHATGLGLMRRYNRARKLSAVK